MTYKAAILNHKAGALAGAKTGLVAKLKSMVKIEIPLGYQDETGFHYGAKSAEKEVKWPSVW